MLSPPAFGDDVAAANLMAKSKGFDASPSSKSSIDKSTLLIGKENAEPTKILFFDLVKVRDVESANKGDCGEDVSSPIRNCDGKQMNVWRKKDNIKVADLQLGNFLAEDRVTVKLLEQNEKENADKLSNSIVIKNCFNGWLIDENMFQWGRKEFGRADNRAVRSVEETGYGPWLIVNRESRRTIAEVAKEDRGVVTDKKIERAADNVPIFKSIELAEKCVKQPEFNTHPVSINPGSVNVLIPTSGNKFSILSSQDEEGEIVQEILEENLVMKEQPKMIKTEHGSNKNHLDHCIEDESIMVKKKKSKQLKDLGPISSNLRSRRMELEAKELVRLHNVIFVGLLETKLSSFKMKEVKTLIGDGWNYVMVLSSGLSGGIIALWNTKVADFSLVDYSSQYIVGDLLVNSNCKWRVAAVYANKECYKRRDLWDFLGAHCCIDFPMVVAGDFNCLTSREDKKGGKKFQYTQGSKEMEAFFTNNDYHDVRFIGPQFTWCNNKVGGARILERLDRCFLNSYALNLSSQLVVKHLVRVAFDHCSIILNILNLKSPRVKNIKFEDVWVSYLAALTVVRKASATNYQGSQAYILNSKFKRTLRSLFFWSKAKMKNLNLFKNKLMEEILELQIKESEIDWLNDEECWTLKTKVLELNSTMARLNTWWRQRAKIGGNIAHGTDGFTYSFLKAYWDIIKIDFVKAISYFLQFGEIDKSWKDTLIVLIPKVSNPLTPSNFRPISLCNSVYKVAAKVISNRLALVIQKLIIEEQAAFINGRYISDHVLVAQEVFHKFRYSKSSKGLAAYKIDMEQAYDSMSWNTLEGVLKYFHFPPLFSKLILECVLEPRFLVIINGNLSDWINAKSGFRQGCPLSPFLFILCSQLLTNALALTSIGVNISPYGPRISHLLFADDVMIFSEANKEVSLELKVILSKFNKWPNGKVGIYYVSWEELCKLVDRRGRGLCSSTSKVVELRARLTWRFLNNRNSLLFKMLAPKYGSKVVEDNTKRCVSSSWKIITEGGKALQPLLKWSVANGSSIDAVEDKWLLDRSINKWHTFVDPQGEEPVKLERLIEGKDWNVAELLNIFGSEMVELISHTKIICDQHEDKQELIFNRSERTISRMIAEAWQREQPKCKFAKWWKKAKLKPRVETFCWRLFKDAIPTYKFIAHRRLQEVEVCRRCLNGIEDMEHVLFNCAKIKEVLSQLNKWGFQIPLFESLQECYRWMDHTATHNGMLLKFFFNVLYLSCKARNKFTHDKVVEGASSVVANAFSFLSTSNLIVNLKSALWDANQPIRLSNTWYPPPPDWLKINVDASLDSSYRAGIGCVIRDRKGRKPEHLKLECPNFKATPSKKKVEKKTNVRKVFNQPPPPDQGLSEF
ncbi:hypothetical protein KFK09_017693 [Dendrobium nobile]|uniref:Reverse transcriptase domain-containing protein n=1 Tax=Dendrobium nobile TaxID=94219 RepID=A0A8T3AT61_DENNO|nr:hypothetical protein KFK09_017693 [Dendrobium nobile]